VLCAVSLPDRGGDTQYVNMHLAYDGLPPAMKAKIDGARAIHVYQSRYSERKLQALPDTTKVPDSVAHPLVRTHPESGRKALYLNPIRTEGIVDMDDAEGLPLLDELLAHATREKYQYRHRWQEGDVGQSLPAAQGQRRLRHRSAPLHVPGDAQGRRAGLRRQ
jgi:taurine dioxygenase